MHNSRMYALLMHRIYWSIMEYIGLLCYVVHVRIVVSWQVISLDVTGLF